AVQFGKRKRIVDGILAILTGQRELLPGLEQQRRKQHSLAGERCVIGHLNVELRGQRVVGRLPALRGRQLYNRVARQPVLDLVLQVACAPGRVSLQGVKAALESFSRLVFNVDVTAQSAIARQVQGCFADQHCPGGYWWRGFDDRAAVLVRTQR